MRLQTALAAECIWWYTHHIMSWLNVHPNVLFAVWLGCVEERCCTCKRFDCLIGVGIGHFHIDYLLRLAAMTGLLSIGFSLVALPFWRGRQYIQQRNAAPPDPSHLDDKDPAIYSSNYSRESVQVEKHRSVSIRLKCYRRIFWLPHVPSSV